MFTKNCFRNYRYVVYLLSLFALKNAQAQCPNPDFSIASTVCVGENIAIDNNSTDAIRYAWDFCASDITEDSIVIESIRDEGLDGVHNLDIIEYQDKYFGFVVNRNTASLLRLDFGSALDNTPRIYDIGNIDDQFSEPIDIDVFQEGSSWYGIVVDIGQSSVHRLSFEDGIESRPSVEAIEQDVLSKPIACSVIIEDGSTFAQIANYGNGGVSILDFENSIKNLPKITSYSVSKHPLSDIDFYNHCGTWFGFATEFLSSNGSIYKLIYSNGLGQPPTVESVNIPLSFTKDLSGISAVSQNDVFHIFFQTHSRKGLYRLDFKDGIDQNPVVTTLNILDQVRRKWGLTIVKDESDISLFSVQREGEIFRGRFLENCYASTPFVNNVNLNEISYSEPGEYTIELTAYNTKGINKSISKTINVNSEQSPALTFQIDSQCFGNTSTLTATADQTLSSAGWSIIDKVGTIITRTGQTVTYDFPSPGTYSITLEVESDNGCGNRLTKEITIYEPPAPAFTAPVGTICTNNPVRFTNTTDAKGAEVDSLITYRWFVDDELVSDVAEPDITFAEGGNRTVRLEASIPGCTEVMEQIISVLPGPVVSFDVAQACQGRAVTFTNQTTGEGITDYAWNFGDGGSFTSATAESPSYTFDEPGTYLVSLSVTNQLGCQNVYRQEVTVYEQPSVGFVSEVACVGTPTQFTDTTTAGTNANVIEWEWSFGDGGTANERNPAHTYSQPGTYEVQLVTQTTAGCVDSAGQTVTVESPVAAGFVATAQCPTASADYRVLLSDTSAVAEGDNVNRWFWSIGNASFVTQNVEYSFPGPGTYPVTLTAFAASGCASTVTRSVVVDSLPAVAFTHPVACTGEPVVFQSEVSTGLTDYRWSFGEVGTAFAANPSFVFDAPGTYEVTLRAQTTAGCPFAATQSVTVTAAPVAAFEASATQGGAPLTVAFTNQSTDAMQYAWDFGGLGTSEALNPTFTFDEVGTYEVTLTATNAVGCVSTAAQTITVRDPVQDIRLDEISVVDNPNGAGQRLLLSVRNVGSLPADSVAIVIGFGEAVSVQEDLPQPLLAGEKRVYVTQFILPKAPGSVRYLCATLTIGDTDFIDASPADNRNCVSLDEQLSTEAPFPNPVRDQLQLPVILPQGDAVSLRLIDSRGQTLRTYRQPNAPAGLNTFVIPTKGLPVGTYLLQMTYRGEQRQWRVGVEP